MKDQIKEKEREYSKTLSRITELEMIGNAAHEFDKTKLPGMGNGLSLNSKQKDELKKLNNDFNRLHSELIKNADGFEIEKKNENVKNQTRELIKLLNKAGEDESGLNLDIIYVNHLAESQFGGGISLYEETYRTWIGPGFQNKSKIEKILCDFLEKLNNEPPSNFPELNNTVRNIYSELFPYTNMSR